MKTAFGQAAAGLRLERMRASARWVGKGFRNLLPILPELMVSSARPSVGDFLCGPNRRPPGPLPSQDPRSTWLRPAETGLRATWLGHSTVLLEVDGVRLLTDPVWGERVSPFKLVGPRRYQPVPVPLAEMPPVDVVLISHDHYDHLDYPTILALVHTSVPFVCPLGVGAHLVSWGVPEERITELDWWESAEIAGGRVRVTAAPSQHFSGRSLGGRDATLWTSYAIRGNSGAIFFSGDTGLTPEYTEIGQRLGPFDLIMLEVGAYHPSWGTIHLGPDNALAAARLLGSGRLLPIHWGTFTLAVHAWDEPAETLLAAAPKAGVSLVTPRLGEAVEPSRAEEARPWWRAVAPAAEPVAEEEPNVALLRGLPLD